MHAPPRQPLARRNRAARCAHCAASHLDAADLISCLYDAGWSYDRIAEAVGLASSTIFRVHVGACKDVMYSTYARLRDLVAEVGGLGGSRP